jgi:hypothetical protein
VWLDHGSTRIDDDQPELAALRPTRQVHHWAKSLTRRGKTDNRDARMLTHYALERQPASWTPPPDVNHELRQRLTARFNPIIKTFYERLHATGKPAKGARCAAVSSSCY